MIDRVSTSRQLAELLARWARRIEGLARERLEQGGALVRGLPAIGAAELADAYAQTLGYGTFVARWHGFPDLAALLAAASPSLRGLFDLDAFAGELEQLADLLAKLSLEDLFAGQPDPSLYFYPDFLDAYDPRQRREHGVFYTPDEVVSCVVAGVDSALRDKFGLPRGLADATAWAELGLALPEGVDPNAAFVQVLDPAAGTGAFLLRVIERVHATMQAELAQLDEAAAHAAWVAYVRRDLLPRISGFELMLAPWVVCHLRLGLALRQTGFEFGPDDRLQILLTDTLEMRASDPLAEALKQRAAISVILGNPPFERTSADQPDKGGWIVRGWSGWRDARPAIEDFDELTRAHEAGGNIQATRNLYHYFWRWAVWRAFDRHQAPAIISFVTPSSYLRGPGFVGLREYVRAACHSVHVLDLEGDQRGTRVTDNVFAIKIPVCIGTLIREPKPLGSPATIHYCRVTGSRAAKLRSCAELDSLDRIPWQRAPATGPWLASGSADYRSWPALSELFPLRFTGYHFYRTWPIAADVDTLRRRWAALVSAAPEQRAALFKQTRDRTISRRYPALDGGERAPAIADLSADAECPTPARTSFRSFDRQWCLADPRLADFIRPSLWRGHGERQIYLTCLMSGVLGPGPGATAAAHVPDCHHFRGSFGGKDVIPLWRDADAREPNVAPGLLDLLRAGPEDLFAYAYAVLANPGYVRRFEHELHVPGPRVPISKDRALFERGVELGRELLRWHCFGERLHSGDGFTLHGVAELRRPISTYPERHRYDPERALLVVGDGEIVGVSPEVWRLSVSGLAVLESWLDYRMLAGAGNKSSALDAIRPERWTEAMTRELLELVWVLDWTVARHPVLDAWLDEILHGELFNVDEM